MPANYERIADYLVMIVSEYALEKGISTIVAFQRLDSCGGIRALEENYDIEHTLPISSTIDALDALYERAGCVA